MKKRIMFVAPSLGLGGMERQLTLLLEHICKEKYLCYLLLFRSKINYKVPKNIILVDMKKKGKIDISFIFRFIITLRKIKPHVIFSTIQGVNNYCQIFGSIFKIPVICSVRAYDLYNEYKVMKIIHLFFPFKSVVCNSNKTKKQLEKHSKIDKKNITVIYNGVDTDKFKSKTPCVYFDNNFLSGYKGFKFLFVGRISPQKNILFLLDALSKPELKNKNFILVLIGEIFDESYYDKCIVYSKNKFENNKIFWESSKSNIEDYYNWADCLILPSLYEGFPNVVLEAMACGSPILISDSADSDGIVENGYNGYRFSLNKKGDIIEKLLLLIENKNKSKYIQRNKEKICKQYSHLLYIEKTVSLIESVSI